METTEKNQLSGGSFIIENDTTRSIFTPEDFSEEQLMMKAAVKEFIDREVWPIKKDSKKKITSLLKPSWKKQVS